MSRETTFDADLADPEVLRRRLWDLAEQLSARAKAKGIAGRVVTLKLKRADHRVLSRRQTLGAPTQMADRIYRTALPMLQRDIGYGPFRLLGVGLAGLVTFAQGESEGDLVDPKLSKRAEAERAADRIRARFGDNSILLGRSLR